MDPVSGLLSEVETKIEELFYQLGLSDHDLSALAHSFGFSEDVLDLPTFPVGAVIPAFSSGYSGSHTSMALCAPLVPGILFGTLPVWVVRAYCSERSIITPESILVQYARRLDGERVPWRATCLGWLGSAPKRAVVVQRAEHGQLGDVLVLPPPTPAIKTHRPGPRYLLRLVLAYDVVQLYTGMHARGVALQIILPEFLSCQGVWLHDPTGSSTQAADSAESADLFSTVDEDQVLKVRADARLVLRTTALHTFFAYHVGDPVQTLPDSRLLARCLAYMAPELAHPQLTALPPDLDADTTAASSQDTLEDARAARKPLPTQKFTEPADVLLRKFMLADLYNLGALLYEIFMSEPYWSSLRVRLSYQRNLIAAAKVSDRLHCPFLDEISESSRGIHRLLVPFFDAWLQFAPEQRTTLKTSLSHASDALLGLLPPAYREVASQSPWARN